MSVDLARRIAGAAELLRHGGIVAYPTETFYGLGALVGARPALERLARAKLRAPDKPLPLLVADRAMALEVVSRFEPLADELAARFWPGPLTLVLPAVADLPLEITAGGNTVGVRMPGSAIARELVRSAGSPIVATSANFSGRPPAADAGELDPALVAMLDGVLDGGPTAGGLPSTVVAVENGKWRLLRPGAVAQAEIERACRSRAR
jgi:L-threonylcarbamoyladenylate synthase